MVARRERRNRRRRRTHLPSPPRREFLQRSRETRGFCLCSYGPRPQYGRASGPPRPPSTLRNPVHPPRLLLLGSAVTGVLALVAGISAVVAKQRAPSPATTLNVDCTSPSLAGELPAVVYLPAGYRSYRLVRYPVIYFLHGLPASTGSYQANAFVARAVAASGHRAIVVAPQGARADGDDREYLDWGATEDWPQAIAVDLTRCIDSRLRTINNRQGRALIGLSAGGFGAFNIGLRRLGTYAAVESWSGYFEATDPTGLRRLDLGTPQANRKAHVPRGHRLKARLAKRPTFIGFYVGRQDSRFETANVLLDQAFAAHHIAHVFRIYQGGHEGSLWTRWAPQWLALALQHMSRPQAMPPS
jgi:enterochelin esterase-like enzyme